MKDELKEIGVWDFRCRLQTATSLRSYILLIFTLFTFSGCFIQSDKIDFSQFKKYKYFDEYKLVGLGPINSNEHLNSSYLVRKYNKDLIMVFDQKSNIMHKYNYKDSIWLKQEKKYDDLLDDTLVQLTYCVYDSLIIKQDFYKDQTNKTSTLEINTQNFMVKLGHDNQNVLGISDIKNVLKKIELNYKIYLQNISYSSCFKCIKFRFKNYILYYKPLKDLESTTLQYSNKEIEKINIGMLVYVYEFDGKTEFNSKLISEETFLKNHPYMKFY